MFEIWAMKYEWDIIIEMAHILLRSTIIELNEFILVITVHTRN